MASNTPSPFTLAALGIGTLGGLAGGVMNAATGSARKRKFLEDEKRKAQILALRNGRMGALRQGQYDPMDFYPTGALNAKEKQRAVQSYADENFDMDPSSFLPFVQNATQLAGGIYDYANAPDEEQPPKRPTQQFLDDWRPSQAPAHTTPADPENYQKPWWEI